MSPIERLADHDIVRIRAGNAGPLTLSGTNTWIVGHDPCWIVDPGPALDEHVAAVATEAQARGGAAGIALTHGHPDHAGAVPSLVAATGATVAAMDPVVATVPLVDGEHFGPLTAIATPGHAPDHLAFAAAGACFTGDAVLGEGSVFVSPDPGALRGYLAGLERLRAMGFVVLCPGHGPPVTDPRTKLDQYVAHRLERERRLVEALSDGLRGTGQLLDRVWDDVPAGLRVAATATLAAHLDKLAEEGRLPDGVGRPG